MMKTLSKFNIALSGITVFSNSVLLNDAHSTRVDRDRPNIIFILADDLGFSDIGCNGNLYYETPNIDKLAGNGLRFTNTYSACPVSSPTRASLLTGKYPARLKLTNFIYGNRIDPESGILPADFIDHLPLNEITIAERLKQNGYKTGISGKWHLGENRVPEISKPSLHGFEFNLNWNFELIKKNNQYEWCEVGKPEITYMLPYLTDKITSDALNFIRSEKDHPFFLYVSHYAVHIPLQGREDLINKYKSKLNPRPGEYNPVYAAMVEQFDESVGRIVQEIENLGLSKNTIIIVTSDNGGLHIREEGPQPTSNFPYRSGKGNIYEGGIKVPLVIYWQGRINPGLSDAMITSTDFFPTLLDLSSTNAINESPSDGISFSKILYNQEVCKRGSIYWHYPHFSNQGGRPVSAIRDGDWKLVKFLENNRFELYNLKEDISEKNNVAPRNSPIVEKMNLQLEEWLKEINANMPKPKN